MVEGQPHNILIGKCHLCINRVEYKDDSEKELGVIRKTNYLIRDSENNRTVIDRDVCRECCLIVERDNEVSGEISINWISNSQIPREEQGRRRWLEYCRLRQIVGEERIIIRNRE